MRVIASQEAADLVRERGGRLYVWSRSSRCCSGRVSWLQTSSEPAGGQVFRSLPADGFELYMPESLRGLPSELHLEVRGRRRRRVEAYWNGCAWIS